MPEHKHRRRLRLQQHTRAWRYFSRMKLLPLRAPAGPLPPLRNALHTRLREALEAKHRKVGPVPPGAFRTPWGWHRIRKTWSVPGGRH